VSTLTQYGRAVVKLAPFVGGGDALPTDTLEKTVAIDRSHLLAYQRVCGFRASDVLPATYPHMLAFGLSMDLMTRLDFPFGVIGLVHIENEATLLRRVTADDTLEVSVHTADLRDHDRGRQFDVVAEARAGDETVWRSRSTYLHRSGGGGGTGDKERTEPPAPSAIWTVPGDTGRRYAAVSGDSNPIHMHSLSARLFGFPGAIAHGMWVKARCLAALEGHLPEAYTVAVRFKLPMLLPAKAAFSSSATAQGREFAVHDARSGKPHAAGSVT
jgi:acyl dehydratase